MKYIHRSFFFIWLRYINTGAYGGSYVPPFIFFISQHNFYRASICEGNLESRTSVRLSVRLSVCLSHAWIVTKLNDALQIF